MAGELHMNFNTISNVKFPTAALDAINKVYLQVAMKKHEISIENLMKVAYHISILIGKHSDLQKYAEYFTKTYTSVDRISSIIKETFEGKEAYNQFGNFIFMPELIMIIIQIIEHLNEERFIELKHALMMDKLIVTPEKGTTRRFYRRFINRCSGAELIIQKNLLLIDLGFLYLSQDLYNSLQ